MWTFLRKLPAAIAGLFLVLGCSIIDLSGFDVETFPAEDGTVLLENDNITVTFSQAVAEKETEGLVSISSLDGEVEIDPLWKDNILTLAPAGPLVPGTRYYLVISGKIHLDRGSYRDVSITVSFFYLSGEVRMALLSATPADTGVAGAYTPLRFVFSVAPMERSFRDFFDLSPDNDTEISVNGSEVTVSPVDSWDPLTSYTWTLDSRLTSINGLPLARTYSGLFLVQEDSTAPSVETIFPTLYTGVAPIPLSADLADIPYEGDIAIMFSESVKSESVRTAFGIEPSIDGQLISHSGDTYVFSPSSGWDFRTEYTVLLSTALKDLEGNPLQEQYSISFTPETIDAVSVVSVTGDGPVAFALDTLAPQPIVPDGLDNGRYSIAITFSEGYDSGLHTAIEDAVSLEFLYPGGITPTIRNRSWNITDTELTVTYENISTIAPLPGYGNLYRFTISGGEGTRSLHGGYIPEDIEIVLESGS